MVGRPWPESAREPSRSRLGGDELHRQPVRVPTAGLDASIIAFPGLEQTITDIDVRTTRRDGTGQRTVTML